jgi:hypothetical protein
MRRREFITLLGRAALDGPHSMTCAVCSRAQGPGEIRGEFVPWPSERLSMIEGCGRAASGHTAAVTSHVATVSLQSRENDPAATQGKLWIEIR